MAKNILAKTLNNPAQPVSVKAMVKTLAIALVLLLGMGLAWVFLKIRKPEWRDRLAQSMYGLLLRIVDVQVRQIGKISTQRPVLIASNHVSYLDVLVLGSCANLRFMPKSEVAQWPLIGTLCRLADCLFVERRARSITQGNDALRERMQKKQAVVLFPESTTGNGLHVLPFKPAFFSVFEAPPEEARPLLQPVAIHYTHVWKVPIDRMQWPDIAWFGDMELWPHLWNVLKMGGIYVDVHWLPVMDTENKDRKQIAQQCQAAIVTQIENARQNVVAIAPKIGAPPKH